MLMAQITESFDAFLLRVARRAVTRLVFEDTGMSIPADEDGSKHDLLAKIWMATRLRGALDEHIHDLIVYGKDRRAAMVTGSATGDRPTWKEIGNALGVSPQAAHRKYGEDARCGDPWEILLRIQPPARHSDPRMNK